mmetsp:Transcript_59607/g.139490  ORF Transcript_59607/g.139490 Transcript_59607/m.139490 type:complete len:167 (-) Transcript_59607:358-858(-)
MSSLYADFPVWRQSGNAASEPEMAMVPSHLTPSPPSQPRVGPAAPRKRLHLQSPASGSGKRVSFGLSEVIEVADLSEVKDSTQAQESAQEACGYVAEPVLSGLAQLAAMRERRLAEESPKSRLDLAVEWGRLHEANVVIESSVAVAWQLLLQEQQGSVEEDGLPSP